MALSGFMLYVLYTIITLMALDILVGLYHSLTSNTFAFSRVGSFLKSGILYSVFPLTILGALEAAASGWMLWVLLILYYLAAIGIIIKYIKDILAKLSK